MAVFGNETQADSEHLGFAGSVIRKPTTHGRCSMRQTWLVAGLLVGLTGSAPLHAFGFQDLGIFKAHFFDQSSSTAPTSSYASVFDFRIGLDVVGPVDNVDFRLLSPTGDEYLGSSSGDEGALRTFFSRTTPAALEGDFPAGVYSIQATHQDLDGGSQSLQSTLSAAVYPASIPTFANFAQASAINPLAAFTFQWNAFDHNPGAGFSEIFFLVDHPTEGVKVDAFLPGDATSYTLAGGVLTPGQHYRATVYFSSRILGEAFVDRLGGTDYTESVPALFAFDHATVMAVTAVPEPGEWALMLAGVAATAVYARSPRGRRQAAASR